MIVRFLFQFDGLRREKPGKGSELFRVGSLLANRWQSPGIPFQAAGLRNWVDFRYVV